MARGVPDAPDGLGEYGTANWYRYWDAGKAHLSVKADYGLMERLCRALDELEHIRNWLAADYDNRAWTMTESGRAFPHPSIKRAEQLDVQTTGWLAQLGFTPSDRARLGLLEVRTPDELDDFRRRQGQRAG